MSGSASHARWAGLLASDSALPWALVVIAGAAIQTGLWLISEPATLFSDFYKAYWPVAESLWFDGPGDTWPLAETGAGSFVNIPILAWLFVPLVALGETGSGWAFLALGVVATSAAWRGLTCVATPAPPRERLLLLLFLANGPLVNSLREGNTTQFILLLLVAALALLRTGRDFPAGLVLGFCAVMKLPLLLYAIYFVVRQRWRVVAGGATMILAVALMSLAVHGWEVNVGWYEDSVAPFLGGVIPAFNVQSIDGFLMRLWTGTRDLQDWQPHQPTLLHRVVRLALVAGLLGGSFWLMRRAGAATARGDAGEAARRRELLEYVLVLNLAIVISPISWSHYYLLLLCPWALYLRGSLMLPADEISRRLIWGGIVLASLPVVILPLGPDVFGELMARTVVSVHLAGGFLTLAALARGLWHMARTPLHP
jgi:hypothetical protein